MASSNRIMTYSQYKANRLARQGKQLSTKDDLKGVSKQSENKDQRESEGEPGCQYEQHISIIQNHRPRRGSMADFAFPELHPKAKLKAEPENLLLLTRTKTDSRGRRHSVAVPLIPPPDGEKFEGGYHIERNPITGAARLVHPSQAVKPQKKISRSSSARNAEKKSSILTTINESSTSTSNIPVCDVNSRAVESGAIPKTRRSRRHSMQVSSLNKDMETLKLTEKMSVEVEKKLPMPGTGVSKERKKDLKRANSKKRSSFLHFLDLAIAN